MSTKIQRELLPPGAKFDLKDWFEVGVARVPSICQMLLIFGKNQEKSTFITSVGALNIFQPSTKCCKSAYIFRHIIVEKHITCHSVPVSYYICHTVIDMSVECRVRFQVQHPTG